MEPPVIRVNSQSPEYESPDEKYIPEPNPNDKRKGQDYKSLGHLLRQCSYPYAGNSNERFWPYTLLQQILTEERLVEELRVYERRFPSTYNSQTIRDYAVTILSAGKPNERYIKVFAILVLIGKGYYIHKFIQEGLCDEDIPLMNCRGQPDCDLMLARRSNPSVEIDCLSEWDFHEREFFLKNQPFVDVVSLGLNPDRSVRHLKFDNPVILPWTLYRKKESGGYGDVYQAKAPARSHNFHNVLDSVSSCVVGNLHVD